MTKHYIIPIFIPHLGCPHDCVFCNQRKIASSVIDVTQEDVKQTIEKYLSYFRKDSFIEVAFYGGSFTAIDINMQKQLLEVPLLYKQNGIIDAIRLSTRPDAIDDHILQNLIAYQVDTIELGVQSLNDTVLSKSARGHTSDDVYRAVRLIKEYKINLGLQMMVGLPGDTPELALKTARKFIELEPDCVRIYPTLVIKDTYLQEMVNIDEYTPLSVSEAVEICTALLMEFYINNINVIRVGLQPTENIQLGKDVVSGPFHPAFKQLVESNIFKIILNNYINDKNIITKARVLEIESSERNISNIAGQKSTNIIYLKEIYKFKEIKLYPSNIDIDEVVIRIDKDFDKLSIKEEINNHIKKA